jgi:threonylcarbamoyladenosine tRNA methylthiotransferase MtaB
MEYFTQLNAGQERPVLFESAGKNGMMEGYTDNYIKVAVPYTEAWANQVINHRL